MAQKFCLRTGAIKPDNIAISRTHYDDWQDADITSPNLKPCAHTHWCVITRTPARIYNDDNCTTFKEYKLIDI